MNKYVFYIVLSVFLILFCLGAIILSYWDILQLKTGAINSEVKKPSLITLLPFFSGLLIGSINLPISIYRYNKNKSKSGSI
ncbi:hypothetical protein ACFOQM_24085 [Paenibacillus sp. GCM10012307]|uniref:Uncharacterized protein n=1 Tax=Paenibacillus roseus TaxID=2798579 RepID=A0A934JCJ3_9BACL|nr:hypothetical protein [Paenibacillus roseus]MBJ6364303.1 hypothetical protein [Paenibacillus roseus]